MKSSILKESRQDMKFYTFPTTHKGDFVSLAGIKPTFFHLASKCFNHNNFFSEEILRATIGGTSLIRYKGCEGPPVGYLYLIQQVSGLLQSHWFSWLMHIWITGHFL